MPLSHDIQLASTIKQSAKILDTSPSWEGCPEHSAWLEKFVVSTDPKMEWHLWNAATDQRILVSAYAIECLSRRESNLLLELPGELTNRAGHLTVQVGSFRQKMLYRDFVKLAINKCIKHQAEQAESSAAGA